MHELSMAMAMVEQIQEIMAQEGAQQLVSVTVVMGALSGVEREAFEFCFPLAVEGTPLAGAELRIEEVPLRLRCLACEKESQPEEIAFVCCAECGSGRVEIIEGRDLVLRSLEVK